MANNECLYIDVSLAKTIIELTNEMELGRILKALISYAEHEPFDYSSLSEREEVLFKLLKDFHDKEIKKKENRRIQNRKNVLSRYGENDEIVGTRTAEKRKAIPKKIRFAVFERDGHTCQYCGRKAPDVVLEVDHIKPVCDGGTNDMDNLITTCVECNLGKGGRYGRDN